MSVSHVELQRANGTFRIGERVRSSLRPGHGSGQITHLRGPHHQECYTYALVQWPFALEPTWEWTGDLERLPEVTGGGR